MIRHGSQPMAKISFISGALIGCEHTLAEGSNSVGRSSDNALPIDHPSISRHHCLILKHGTEIIVRELGSYNGTYVNGERVNGQRVAGTGTVIRFGDVQVRVYLESDDVVEYSPTPLTALHEAARFEVEEERRLAKVQFSRAAQQPALGRDQDSPTRLAPPSAGEAKGDAKKCQTMVNHPKADRHPFKRGTVLLVTLLALVLLYLLGRRFGRRF